MYGHENGTYCRDQVAPAETARTPLSQLPDSTQCKNDPGKAGSSDPVQPEKKTYEENEEDKEIVQKAGPGRRGARKPDYEGEIGRCQSEAYQKPTLHSLEGKIA